MTNKTNNMRLFHGDCLEVLRTLPDNSVDSCVTDPPYGLSREPDIREVLTKWLAGEPYDHGHGGFMGKAWDSFVPHPDIWREVYRVLKPGGHALVFAGTRTQDLMTISLRLAGFEVRDVIEWLYFSGFPKSLDVGKAFDRRRKEDLPAIRRVCRFIRAAMDAKGLKSRDLVQYFDGCHPRLIDHWAARDTDSQPAVPKWEQYSTLKRVLGLSDEMDEEVWRLNGRKGKPGDAWFEREKIGEYEYKRKGEGTWDVESPGGMFGAQERIVDITAPATELARKWDGWGTALKPAHEPIIVVRKPLEGTVAENVEKYGTGALNIDGCRIDYADDQDRKQNTEGLSRFLGTSGGWKNTSIEGVKPSGNAIKGRFPANCITTEPDAFFSKYFNVTPPELCKKALNKDRNSDWRGEEIGATNRHPTVKPTGLMAWLVRLVTPPGGVVLDPFAGSGSTLVAARREGFGFIGCEITDEYIPIIEARAGVKA